MADLYPITVDTREKTPPSEVRVKELADRGIPAVLGLLPVADYHWVVADEVGQKLVFVERKAIPDLLSSAEDGRLTRFIDETGGTEPDPEIIRAILLEGDQFTYGNYGYTEWNPERIDNLLVSLQSTGVLVLRSAGVRQTADRIAAFWKYTGRDDHRTLLRVLRPAVSDNYLSPNKRAAVRILMGLPDWGETRARAALGHFGTVDAVFEAIKSEDPKLFKDVKGIGKQLIVTAAEFLRREV